MIYPWFGLDKLNNVKFADLFTYFHFNEKEKKMFFLIVYLIMPSDHLKNLNSINIRKYDPNF